MEEPINLKEQILTPAAAFTVKEDNWDFAVASKDAAKLYQQARNIQLGTLAASVSREKKFETISG